MLTVKLLLPRGYCRYSEAS